MERIRLNPEELAVSTFAPAEDDAAPLAQPVVAVAYSVGCKPTWLLCPSSDGRCIYVE